MGRRTIRWYCIDLVVVLGLVTGACTGDVVCIAEPAGPPIVVAIVDAVTGQSVVDAAQGFVRLGTVRTDLVPYSVDSAGRLRALAAPVSIAGSYQLVIARSGYALFDTTGIRVVDYPCGLIGPVLRIALRPLPPLTVGLDRPPAM